MAKFLTTTEAAALLGVTEQAVTLNCRAGDLPGAIQPWGKGRGWLIPASAVASRQRKKAKNQLNRGGRPRKSLSA